MGDLKCHKEQVSSRHEEVRNRWAQANQFHELWKYITLPLLSILAQVQEYMLEISERSLDAQSRRLALLEQANTSMDAVKQHVGSVESWLADCSPGPAHKLWKDTAGKRLMDCEERPYTEIENLLDELPKLVTLTLEERSDQQASVALPSPPRTADRPAASSHEAPVLETSDSEARDQCTTM